MNLKINCNEKIKLDKLVSLEKIECEVYNYELSDGTLKGSVKIFGNYQKVFKNKIVEREFEEIYPFTIVFKNEKINIMNINCNDFKYDIVENDINFSFEINIDYDEIISEEVVEVPVITEAEIIPVISEVKASQQEESFENSEIEEILQDALQQEEMIQEESFENKEIEEILQDATEITNEYQNMLDKILEIRNDNFFENDDYSLKKEVKDSSRVSFRNKKDTYSSLKVYYTFNEQDIEKISKIEKCPIEKVFSENKDYEEAKRIIIK